MPESDDLLRPCRWRRGREPLLQCRGFGGQLGQGRAGPVGFQDSSP